MDFSIRNQRKQLRFEALSGLHKIVASEDMQEAISFLHDHDENRINCPKTPKERAMIELFINTYDLVGFRIRQGVLPKNPTLDTEWLTLFLLKDKLNLFIEHRRRRRKVEGDRFKSWKSYVRYKRIHKRSWRSIIIYKLIHRLIWRSLFGYKLIHNRIIRFYSPIDGPPYKANYKRLVNECVKFRNFHYPDINPTSYPPKNLPES